MQERQDHDRRDQARAGAAVRRAGDPEPGRVRGHLPAAGGGAGPVSWSGSASAIPGRRRPRRRLLAEACRPRSGRLTCARSRTWSAVARGPGAPSAGIEGTEPLRQVTLVAVCEATRKDERVELGARAPVAGLMLFRAAQGRRSLLSRARGPTCCPTTSRAARPPPSLLAQAAPLLRGRRRFSAENRRPRGRIDRVPALLRLRRAGGVRLARGRPSRPPLGDGPLTLVGARLRTDRPRLVCGIALLVMVIGRWSPGWSCRPSGAGPRGARPGARAGLEESDPYPLRIVLRRTLLPPPGGELIDPLLEPPLFRSGPRLGRGVTRGGGRLA